MSNPWGLCSRAPITLRHYHFMSIPHMNHFITHIHSTLLLFKTSQNALVNFRTFLRYCLKFGETFILLFFTKTAHSRSPKHRRCNTTHRSTYNVTDGERTVTATVSAPCPTHTQLGKVLTFAQTFWLLAGGFGATTGSVFGSDGAYTHSRSLALCETETWHERRGPSD